MAPDEIGPHLTEFADRGSKLVARRFLFTQKRIDALPPPTNGQRAYYYDTKVRGLAIAVSPAGRKVFVLYRKVQGRPERIQIGLYPDLSIEQARGNAEGYNSDIAKGKNPAQEKRAVRDEWTLKQLFDHYGENHAKKKKSWPEMERIFDFYLRGWHLRKISSIRRADVVALSEKLGRTRGPYQANRVIELLSAMFNRARNDWDWSGDNPAAHITAHGEEKRDRFLVADELPRFFRALRAEENKTVRDYILVSLLTGARRSNVLAMRWDELQLERDVWRIPETKSGEPQDVYISEAVRKILRARQKRANGNPWVFQGPGEAGHLADPKKAWRRILTRAGLVQIEGDGEARKVTNQVRLHDLRRTLGSWQAATGASLPVIGKSLGHKSLGATQIYARLDLSPIRQSVDAATAAMLAAARKRTRKQLLEAHSGK